MKVNIEIDLKDQKSRNALRALINAMEVDEVSTPSPEVEEPKEVAPEPKKAPAKKAPAKKAEPVQDEPTVEPKVEEAQEVEPAAEESSSLDIAEVRVLLASKIQAHRAAIKAKLTELGADNLTKLDSSRYEDFSAFLNTLK